MKTVSAPDDAADVVTDVFFRQLCASLGAALIATDPDLRIQVWNAAAARMFGAGAERMIGTSVTAIVPQERRRLAERVFARVLRTGELVEFEFHHRDIHGVRRELIVTIAPVNSELHMPIGVTLCICDITRRLALQNELNESRKMQALGDMANAVAHNFNNIIGGIITSIDYAKSSDDPAVVTKVLDQTSRALLRATTLVNGLLVFSGGGRSPDDLADLTEVLFELADEVERDQAGPRRITLALNVPKLPVIPIARTHLQTILRNLIQNSIEAMPDGGTLRLDAGLEDDWISIAVSDTGSGMDEQTRSRLFEPFWTTKGRTSHDSTRVKGLGLAVAYGLVQVLGGTVSVTSEPGKGSSFRVLLPRPDQS